MEIRPLLAAMREALPFPFNSHLAGDPLERLVAVGLCCRISLLFQKIALLVSSAQACLLHSSHSAARQQRAA